MVVFDNGLGDGKPHAEAAGKRPRLVRAVEPVEQPVQLEVIHVRAGVFHNEHRMVPVIQLHPDHAARIAVFDCVVQQDGGQAAHQCLVPVIGQIGRDVGGQRLAALGSQRRKFGYRVQHRAAQVEVGNRFRRIAFVHAGQGDHLVDEQLHALALAADVLQPFVFPDLGFHDVQIGEDERQRGLELVVCVGDELLLLFVALRHRAHCAPRDQNREHQDEQRAAQQHQKGGEQLAEGHILLHIAVDKHKHGACLTRDSLVAVVGHPAALVPFRCRAGRKIRDLLL